MSTSRRRTRGAVAVAGAAVVAMIGGVMSIAGPAGAVPGFEFTRLQGPDRWGTAAAIARASFPTATTALLANGESADDPNTPGNEDRFADALAGSYLAGARTAPTLLTTVNTLPAATADALDDIGITTVVILGGPAVVSSAQEQRLKSAGYTVQRIQGTDRYATAAAIARTPGTGNVGTVDGQRTAIVASGQQFPDALVTGPLAYAGKLPLLLTDPQRLPSQTRSALTDLDVDHVLIPGGTTAVSQAVEDEIKRLGITVQRFRGATRTQTASLVAEFALAELGFSRQHVNLALGLRFPDALAGAPHAGRERSPILLTDNVDVLGSGARNYLQAHADTLQDGHIFGGTSAVSARVEREAETAAQGSAASPSPSTSASPTASATPTASPSPGTIQSCGTNPVTTSPSPTASPSPSDTATATISPSPSASASASASASPTENPNAGGGRTILPELVSVAYAGAPTLNDAGTPNDTRDDYCTVQVRYGFDEPVIGKQPVATRFLLIGYDPSVRYSGATAVVESSGTSVLVTFGRANNPATTADERVSVGGAQTGQVSLAAVDAAAVADNSGRANPIGDLPLGSSAKPFLYSPGITAAPDLVAVDLVSSGATAAGLRFEFDETVVSVAKPTGFHVVTQDSRDVACTNPILGGTTVTVSCAVAAADVLSRGYVESGTVSDAASDGDGNLNPLHAEPVEQGAVTVAPDLVSAQFLPGSAANNDDKVLFTFSESVFIGDGTRFMVYMADASELNSTSAVRQSDPTKVLATFPDLISGPPLLETRTPALTDAVGASVLEGAVIEAGGANRPNQEDEVGVQNLRTTDTTAGRTSGPDLMSVTVDTSGLRPTATFVFDEVLAEDPSTVVPAKLVLYKADGTAVPCRSAVWQGDESVLCTSFGSGTANPSPEDAVIGTADNDAVQDADGTGNPEGVALVTAVTA